MATHSSILAQRIPWTEELGGIQSTDGGVTFDGNRNRTALFRLCLSLVSCPTRTTDDLLSSNS